MKKNRKMWLCFFIAALSGASCTDGGSSSGVDMTPVSNTNEIDAGKNPETGNLLSQPPVENTGSEMTIETATTPEPEPSVEPASTESEMGETVSTVVEPDVSVAAGGNGGNTVEVSITDVDETTAEPETITAPDPEPTSTVDEGGTGGSDPVGGNAGEGGAGGDGGNTVTEPETSPEPETATEPEPSAEPETVPEPETATTPEPEPTSNVGGGGTGGSDPVGGNAGEGGAGGDGGNTVTEPETSPEPETATEPEPSAEPEPNPEPEPACVPTPKAPATGALETVDFSEPAFHEVGEEQAVTYDCFCRSASDCYCTMQRVGNGKLFHWDGVGYTEEAIPSNLNAWYITGDDSELWLSGGDSTQTLRPVVFRKVGNGGWEEVTAGLPTGWSMLHAIGKVGSSVFVSVTDSLSDINTIYEWSGTSWEAIIPAFNGGVRVFGEASEEAYVGGWTGPAGNSTDALLLRWNDCEWEDHSANLPSGMKNVSSISGVNGEVVLSGNLGGIDENGMLASSTDLLSWEPFVLPVRHTVNSVVSVGRGASVAVGVYRQLDPFPADIAFFVERSVGVWGSVQYLPGYEASSVVLNDGAGTILTRKGIATTTRQ